MRADSAHNLGSSQEQPQLQSMLLQREIFIGVHDTVCIVIQREHNRFLSLQIATRATQRPEQASFLAMPLLSQVLRIHLSSEDDPFLLHTLEVSEEEFQTLKAEQGILVDFGNFPGKIISLLERCVASCQEIAPRCGFLIRFYAIKSQSHN